MPQLLAAGVAAAVYVRVDGLIDDPGSAAEQIVNGTGDRLLVARHGARAEDDGIVVLDFDEWVIAPRDAAEHAGRFALTAGRQQDDFFGRQAVDLAQLDQAPLGDVHEPQLAGDLQVLLHAAADDRRFAAELVRRSDHLTQATDVRCERRDQHPTGRIFDQQLELFAHAGLGRGPARLLDAHTITQ